MTGIDFIGLVQLHNTSISSMGMSVIYLSLETHTYIHKQYEQTICGINTHGI
uniref:Uncharacterized protein n=1 Tax=Arion vulgaris TaxID=1028688 RepID=A0A0B7AQS6_9EUPU